MPEDTETDHASTGARAEPGGAWAREVADTYSRIALETSDPRKAAANTAEASKYYAIADRMVRALPADENGRS